MSTSKHSERGTIHTRRNVAAFDAHDPYNPRLDRGEVAVCTECHALYQRRHWFFDEELYFHHNAQPETQKVLYAEGQVILRSSPFLTMHKDEVLRLVHNEEDRAKGTNPLERIIAISESAEGITVTTTNEKLAQRIGRALKSAYQGHTSYCWSDPKFLAVEWQRSE